MNCAESHSKPSNCLKGLWQLNSENILRTWLNNQNVININYSRKERRKFDEMQITLELVYIVSYL